MNQNHNLLPEISGILLVDKPKDWTSFDVVAKLRSITKVKKIGHAGTLDPLATGLLIVLIGKKFTRQQDEFMKQDKTYLVQAVLGQTSPSYDLETTTTQTKELEKLQQLTLDKIKQVMTKFTGQIKQQVPLYSAVKVSGKKLYQLTDQAEALELRPVREVTIHEFELLGFDQKTMTAEFSVTCSSGTYIRSLIHDLGGELGVGAVVAELRRTKIGKISVEKALPVDDFSLESIRSSLQEKL